MLYRARLYGRFTGGFMFSLAMIAVLAIMLSGSSCAAPNPPVPAPIPPNAFAQEINQLVRQHRLEALASLTPPVEAKANEHRMAQWRTDYLASMTAFTKQKTEQYNKAVTKAQAASEKGKIEEALSYTVGASMMTSDADAYRALPWVVAITEKAKTQAAAYEKAGQWIESLQLYGDLNALYEVAGTFKADYHRLSRRTRLLAQYTPKTYFDLRRAMLQKQLDAAATQPTTQSAATQNSAAQIATTLPDADLINMPRWQDKVAGIVPDLGWDILERARNNWVEQVTYEAMANYGLDMVGLFLDTPEMWKEFPGLNDATARANFAGVLATLRAQIKDNGLAARDLERLYRDLIKASTDTVKIPEAVLVKEFTEGALEKLDQFTAVIWPTDKSDFEKNTKGSFGGVGIQISSEDGQLKVISPLEDTPAFRAGIQAGDVIVGINGKTAVGMNIDQAVRNITGEPNTKVVLQIRRRSSKQPLDFELTRAIIKVSSIKGIQRDPQDIAKWNFLIDPEQKIGYIRITQFQEDTAEQLRAALNTLEAQGLRGLVVDLRFNPGGYLSSAIEISDMFLDEGTIVSTKGRTQRPNRWPATSELKVAKELPMMVLVNQHSASASEIFSGAMRDLGRATIVGQRSFGKGSVQNINQIGWRGEAILKVTTSYYYLPNNESLHRTEGAKTWGVEPDVIVEMTPAQTASLLKQRRDSEIIAARNATQPDDATTQPTTGPAATQAAEEPVVDAQLETALILLRTHLSGATVPTTALKEEAPR
jgi:carboxyl-terminal processing protease